MKSTSLLYLITFIANATILVFEIAGARQLAPYLGTSVEVWSGTIAVILGAMAAGYFAGGFIADKAPTKKTLSLVLFLASLAAFLAWGLRDLIPALFSGFEGAPLTFAAAYTAALLFAPTVIFLAAVSPFIAKFLLVALESSAKTIGKINAVGTLGSIAGALLSGAFLIPHFGLDRIFLGIAVTLLALALLTSLSKLPQKAVAVGAVLAVSLLLGTLSSIAIGRTIVADLSTTYNRIWILETAYAGKDVLALQTDPFGIQCGMNVQEDGSLDEYLLARYPDSYW